MSLLATEAYAAGESTLPLLDRIKVNVVNPIIGLLFGVAFLYFLWGVIQFIQADDKTRDVGKQHIIYGLIGLFIMVSAFGLTNFIIESIKSLQ